VRAVWTQAHGRLPSHAEAARALGVSRDTVRRYWRDLRGAGFSEVTLPRANFVLVPKALVADPALDVACKATAAYIANCVGADGRATVSQATLAVRLRRKEGTVKGYIRQLREAGYLVADVAEFAPGIGRRLHCNGYRLTTPKAPTAPQTVGAKGRRRQ
jgi:biotin operon repressor